MCHVAVLLRRRVGSETKGDRGFLVRYMAVVVRTLFLRNICNSSSTMTRHAAGMIRVRAYRNSFFCLVVRVPVVCVSLFFVPRTVI